MKVFNAVFAVIFLLFAGWQFNDPDPVLWVLVYGFVSMVCIFALLKKVRKFYLFMGLVVLGALAIAYFPGVLEWITSGEQDTILQGMDRKKPFLEETREFFGLLIGIMVLVVNLIKR